MGPIIQNSDHRHGVGIDDSAAQVALAGNRYDDIRPRLLHNTAGDGSTRRNEQREVELLGYSDKVLDRTAAAPFAIPDIVGNADFTIADLQAVREQKEN